MTDSLLERIQKEPAVIMEFAQALIREKNRVKALEVELNTVKPKADYYDAFINPDDCTNIRTTAKEARLFVKSAMEMLSPLEQEIFSSCLLGEMPIRQFAERNGMRKSTAWDMANSIRKKLQEIF